MRTFNQFLESFTDRTTAHTPDPSIDGDTMSVEEYERQSRIAGTLPKGWDDWTEIQKLVHLMVAKARRAATTKRH